LGPSQSTIKKNRFESKPKTQGEFKGMKHILISSGKAFEHYGSYFQNFWDESSFWELGLPRSSKCSIGNLGCQIIFKLISNEFLFVEKS
jgi:hypothetical protein